MNLRRFTNEGIVRFEDYLIALRSDPRLRPPHYFLADSSLSEEVSSVEIEQVHLVNRLEAAQWVDSILETASVQDPARDKGLWAWLSLFLFDSVCPPDNDGSRKPGETARHIPDSANFQRYYRHLLAGPWRIFRAYRDSPESALALLCQPVHRPGEIVEQFASRQELVTNRAFIAAATSLYVDAATRSPRKGSGGKGRGTPRRLADFCNQIDVTWDLYAMDAGDLLGMLPKEFDSFRSDT